MRTEFFRVSKAKYSGSFAEVKPLGLLLMFISQTQMKNLSRMAHEVTNSQQIVLQSQFIIYQSIHASSSRNLLSYCLERFILLVSFSQGCFSPQQ